MTEHEAARQLAPLLAKALVRAGRVAVTVADAPCGSFDRGVTTPVRGSSVGDGQGAPARQHSPAALPPCPPRGAGNGPGHPPLTNQKDS